MHTCRDIVIERYLIFAKTIKQDLHKLALPTNYTMTICTIVREHQFNNTNAELREKAIIHYEKTIIRQKFLDIWRRFTLKSSSGQIYLPPAYVDVVSVPNRQVRPALTRPGPFTADIKRLYTIKEVNRSLDES